MAKQNATGECTVCHKAFGKWQAEHACDMCKNKVHGDCSDLKPLARICNNCKERCATELTTGPNTSGITTSLTASSAMSSDGLTKKVMELQQQHYEKSKQDQLKIIAHLAERNKGLFIIEDDSTAVQKMQQKINTECPPNSSQSATTSDKEYLSIRERIKEGITVHAVPADLLKLELSSTEQKN